MSLRIEWKNIQGLRRFEEAVGTLGDGAVRQIGNRAINRAGDQARTQVRRVLPKQTGLKRAVIVKAVRVSRSTPGTLSYTMTSWGGDISLKYFAARENKPGVSAAPFGQRKVFGGTFMKAGWIWSQRVVKPNWNGQVFARNGDTTKSGMDAFSKVKSGVYIPKEMVKGATADAFTSTVEKVLPERLAHELSRATNGVVT